MSRELPNGWCWAAALDLCEAIPSGATPPANEMTADEGEIPFLKVYNLTFDGTLDFSNKPTFVSRETHERRLKRSRTVPGDVLMNIVGPPLGKVSVVPDTHPEWNFNQAIVAFKTLPTVVSNWYLAAFLRSPELLAWTGFSSKATVGQFNLSVTSCRELPIPLAPPNEQKRIVAKIDALTDKSREAREALDEVPDLLDKLRQSILAAAFRGDLTKKWREQNPNVEPASVLLERIRKERRKKWEEAELAKFKAKGKVPKDDKWKAKYKEPEPVDTEGLPELPEGWCWASLEETCPIEAPVVYGIIQPGPDHPAGVPYIRPIDMTWDGKILPASVRLTSPEIAVKYTRSELKEGDIILSIVGTIGKVVITPSEYAGANITQSAVRIRPPHDVSGRLLSDMLRSPLLTRQFEKYRFGNAVQRLNVEHARALAIPLIPIREAQELEKLIDGHLVTLSSLVGASSREQLNKLDASILAKAFRGELVPQDPNDEPASVLLERIRAERKAAGGGKKKSSKRKRKG